MLNELSKTDEEGKPAAVSCSIQVGSRKLGLTIDERPYITALLEAARHNLLNKIERKKKRNRRESWRKFMKNEHWTMSMHNM